AARRENQGGAARANDVIASDTGAIVCGRPAGARKDPAAPAGVIPKKLLLDALVIGHQPGLLDDVPYHRLHQLRFVLERAGELGVERVELEEIAMRFVRRA